MINYIITTLSRLKYSIIHPQWISNLHQAKLHKLIAKNCSGRLLDIGSGNSPIKPLLPDSIEYLSLDFPSTNFRYENTPTVFGDAQSIPFADGAFDTVLLTEVLEHLGNPKECLLESNRILKDGGRLFITAPFLYPLHDAPFDFFRFSEYGLFRLVDSARFKVENIEKYGNPIQILSYFLNFNLLSFSKNAYSKLGGLIFPFLVTAYFLCIFINIFNIVFLRILPGKVLYFGSFVTCIKISNKI